MALQESEFRGAVGLWDINTRTFTIILVHARSNIEFVTFLCIQKAGILYRL
jgi:hypothetical protein